MLIDSLDAGLDEITQQVCRPLLCVCATAMGLGVRQHRLRVGGSRRLEPRGTAESTTVQFGLLVLEIDLTKLGQQQTATVGLSYTVAMCPKLCIGLGLPAPLHSGLLP